MHNTHTHTCILHTHAYIIPSFFPFFLYFSAFLPSFLSLFSFLPFFIFFPSFLYFPSVLSLFASPPPPPLFVPSLTSAISNWRRNCSQYPCFPHYINILPFPSFHILPFPSFQHPSFLHFQYPAFLHFNILPSSLQYPSFLRFNILPSFTSFIIPPSFLPSGLFRPSLAIH